MPVDDAVDVVVGVYPIGFAEIGWNPVFRFLSVHLRCGLLGFVATLCLSSSEWSDTDCIAVVLVAIDFAIDGLIFESRFAFLEGNVALKCRATLDGKRRPFSRGSSHATLRTLHVLERERPFLNRLPSFNFLKIRVASSWYRVCRFLFRCDFDFDFVVAGKNKVRLTQKFANVYL